MKLHLLQSTRHLGALTGSRTRVPLSHSGQEDMPCLIMLCLHLGWGQSVQGMPPFSTEPSDPLCNIDRL